MSGVRALRELERARAEYGRAAEARKHASLRSLGAVTFARASEVRRFHEALCFLRAYPDSRRVLRRVERLLRGFAARSDLRRHRAALAGSGIAGTATDFRFFWPTARWLAARWGARLSIRWEAFEEQDRLDDLLPLMTLFAETPALDEIAYTPRQWLRRLRGPGESDASFLIRRIERLPGDEFAREKLYDQLDPPLRLAPGPGTPSRTLARTRRARVVFQRAALARTRPDLHAALRGAPPIREVPRAQALELIDLARGAMVTRERDLDAFSWADPDDVRMIDGRGGLAFACIGVLPERRLLLESVYAMLTLKNGVPIGYVLTSALLGSSEIAYNVFETWRGTEAAPIYGRVLAMVHRLFGSDSFTIYPYQLGDDNEEALESGAWWFYQKLGFRPRDPATRRLMDAELARMRRRPAHRSSRAMLARLARVNLYFHAGRPRTDVIGLVPLPAVGLAVQSLVAARFGSDRERAARECAEQAAALLCAAPGTGWSAGETLAWQRWSPLVLTLPGIARWSAAERRALVDVIRAKGGRRESEFVRRFDAHRRLRSAVVRLAIATDAANP